jgi:D-alanyl-lipoteichoic acid acyltransferase DltB (MBOAT superfamily)
MDSSSLVLFATRDDAFLLIAVFLGVFAVTSLVIYVWSNKSKKEKANNLFLLGVTIFAGLLSLCLFAYTFIVRMNMLDADGDGSMSGWGQIESLVRQRSVSCAARIPISWERWAI